MEADQHHSSHARRRVSRIIRMRLHPTASGVVVSFPLALWRTLQHIRTFARFGCVRRIDDYTVAVAMNSNQVHSG